MLSRSWCVVSSAGGHRTNNTAVTAICEAAATVTNTFGTSLSARNVIQSDLAPLLCVVFKRFQVSRLWWVFEIRMRRTASLKYAGRTTVVLHHLSGGVPAFRLNSDLCRTVIFVE